MVLTEIGEVGVYAGESLYVLRPSLYAMSRLGDPAEIVALYASVMEAPSADDAAGVIYACAQGADLDGLYSLFGHWLPDGNRATWVSGSAGDQHARLLAQSLLRHGITGAVPPAASDGEEYSQTFNAREHAAMAMAHLGLSEREAWGMTMTGLIVALRAKFPPQKSNAPGASAPTKEEHERTMEWFERVEAARMKKSGPH